MRPTGTGDDDEQRGETNLRVLRPSRKKPKAGEVFALQLVDGRYLFGRVISTEAIAGPSMGGAILIYVYRERSDQKELPERAELRPDRLLVSPIMTNQQPWTKGYFETIENLPLDGDDVLSQHCFRRWDGRYFDEALNEFRGRSSRSATTTFTATGRSTTRSATRSGSIERLTDRSAPAFRRWVRRCR